jgi:predicted DsbA family dithiol-disulfide isomerase
MNKKDHFNEDMIYQIAKDAGLDVEKLKKDMNDDAIAKQIQANVELGGDIGVRGTPMFIVGEQVYPGALQYDQLKKAVDDARAATTKKN